HRQEHGGEVRLPARAWRGDRGQRGGAGHRAADQHGLRQDLGRHVPALPDHPERGAEVHRAGRPARGARVRHRGARGRGEPRRAGWRTLLLAVVAIAVALLLTDLLRVKLPADSAYVLICVAAAALAWFAAVRASVVRLESLRSGGYAWDEDTGSFVRYHDEDTGDFAYAEDTGGFRRFRGET